MKSVLIGLGMLLGAATIASGEDVKIEKKVERPGVSVEVPVPGVGVEHREQVETTGRATGCEFEERDQGIARRIEDGHAIELLIPACRMQTRRPSPGRFFLCAEDRACFERAVLWSLSNNADAKFAIHSFSHRKK